MTADDRYRCPHCEVSFNADFWDDDLHKAHLSDCKPDQQPPIPVDRDRLENNLKRINGVGPNISERIADRLSQNQWYVQPGIDRTAGDGR